MQPWVEKYRPRRVKDVVHHDHLKRVLKGAEKTGDLPHLLFHGPPGTGKTSTILALARTLLGEENMRERVLELNASDERGLDVVRDKIKTFCKMSISSFQPGCPPFKLVILDEADTMTADAQSALRRTMETQAVVTRFCLVCNYVSKIIAPLASRCAKFRFSTLTPESMKGRLLYICERENIIFENCSRGVLDAIVKSSRGDMRSAVNLLQTVSQQQHRVTPESVVEVAGEVPERAFDTLWSAVTSPSHLEHFEDVVDAVSTFVGEGYPVGKVLSEIQSRVVQSGELENADKAVICLELMETDRCLNDGADEELQLLNICLVVQSAL
ncbi:EsV-1-182, RFC small subunit [Ectocarpus siliculosus]|uniref:EsV-1-182, RFC small subunit n=1 Tax=Ectocarpus siliculosus TaxID=2880 RepID=D8LPK1_ECTSI|nr:EsV-1-182, RFC small subunit [Ectocarpus siliculosus]|eukprot:CBN80473.1 EsV-1-182, RFC small subunit [Ectocarpus siliculosus]